MALCLGRALRRPDYLGEKFTTSMSCWLKVVLELHFSKQCFLKLWSLKMLFDTKKNHVK